MINHMRVHLLAAFCILLVSMWFLLAPSHAVVSHTMWFVALMGLVLAFSLYVGLVFGTALSLIIALFAETAEEFAGKLRVARENAMRDLYDF